MGSDERIATMTFASVYPYYIAKVEKKWRTEAELLEVISWLTGYDEKEVFQLINDKVSFEYFFDNATLHPNAHMITWTICWCKIGEITNPLTKKVRYLDKIVDELAKWKPLEKILRKK